LVASSNKSYEECDSNKEKTKKEMSSKMPLNRRSSTWNLFVLEGNIKKTSTQETCITHAKQNG
jgi:hypothetical protein